MARYTGPKEKMSRKIGRNLFSKGSRSFSAKAAVNRRSSKPGMHGKTMGNKLSEYGKQLLEKQIIRHIYGLMEKQFRKTFDKALRIKGDTSLNLLTLLETRLDNVVYKAGLAESRSQARQLVNHAHFLLNGHPVSIPSLNVKAGDKIELKPSKKKKAFWVDFNLSVPGQKISWLESDSERKTIKVITLPLTEDLPTDLNPKAVIELYSR